MIPQKNKSASVLLRPIAFGSLGFVFLMFMLPVYGKSMGANALDIGGLFSAFTATSLFLRPLIGWALDRFGRQPFFITALCGNTIAMILLTHKNMLNSPAYLVLSL